MKDIQNPLEYIHLKKNAIIREITENYQSLLKFRFK